MSDQKYDFGLVGLGVMGRNFILNVADNGFSAYGLDTDEEKASTLEAEAAGKPVKGTTSMAAFVEALKPPRVVMMLVPAGKPVDAVIEGLIPLLDKGDLVIDGGNSYYTDTDRREAYLGEKEINFLGVGVSGGAKGARRGPSIMPGGPKEAYEVVRPILEAVSAKVNGEPCVTYLGPKSAGNYVKMVHNGIEYGLMQMIGETYDILKRGVGLSNEELHEAFKSWNDGKLQSFLIEITAAIFTKKDDLTDGDLVDMILDKAKQKGTGKWTSQNAMDLGMPIPSIDTAVTMREISSFKDQRVAASEILKVESTGDAVTDKAKATEMVGEALYFAFIVAYAQGMALLKAASDEYEYNLDLESTARIWRGGCIIRAALLEDIMQAYKADANLANLMVSPAFAEKLLASQQSMRDVLKFAIDQGIPTPSFSASLNYFDAYRSDRLSLNVTQAQRDFFGSHTYERIDREGIFHTEWE